MVDESRSQNQNQSPSKRTWESVGQENLQADYNQSLKNTNRLPTTSTKLADVLKPPTTALTSSLPSGSYSTGFSTIAKPKTSSGSSGSSGSISSGGSYPMTTISTPTPSAETLTGTSQQREEQIQSFQRSQTPIQGNSISNQLSKYQTDYQKGIIERDTYAKESRRIDIADDRGFGFVKDVGKNKFDVFGFKMSGALAGSGFGLFTPIGKSAFEAREEKRKKVAGKKEYESVNKYLTQSPEFGTRELTLDIVRNVSSKRKSEFDLFYKEKQTKAEQELTMATSKIESGGDYNTIVKDYQKNIGKLNIDIQNFDVPKGVSRDVLGQPISKVPKEFQSISQFGISSVPNITQKTITQKEIEKQISPEMKLLQKGYKEIGIESSNIYSSKQIIEGSKGLAKDYGKYLIPEVGPALFLAESSVNIQKGILQKSPSEFALGVGGVALGLSGVSSGVKAFKQEAQMFQAEKNIAKGLEKIGVKNFELGKLGEIRITGERDLSIVKGFREAGGFRQNIDIIGNTIKFDTGSFFSTGKGSSRIAGTIEADINKEILFGPKIKPFKGQFYSEETFKVGSKGLPIAQGEFNTLTLSKGVVERDTISSSLTAFDKNFKSSYLNQMSNVIKSSDVNKGLFLSTTRKVNDNLFVSNIGKIKNLEYYPEMDFKVKGEYSKFELPNYKDDFSKIKVYHATKKDYLSSIYDKGLIPSKSSGIHGVIGTSDKVFTVTSKDAVKGYKTMLGKDGTKLTIDVPKEQFFNAVRKGGIGQATGTVKFESVPKEWIRKPIEFKYPFEFNKKVSPSVNIDVNMKDYLITRTIPKSSISKVDTFEMSSKGSNLKLNQLTSNQLTSISSQQIKESFSPKQLLKPLKQTTQSGFKLTGFKPSSQLGMASLNKQRYGSAFSPVSGLKGLSTFDSFKPQSKFFSSSLEAIKPSTSLSSQSLFKQSSSFKQSSLTIQDLGLKELSSSTNPFAFTPFGTGSGFGGGGGGFGFALPQFSLGGNYLVSKPRKKSKRKKQKIRPSFTAQVFDIRGSMPKQGKYGVNPFDIRKIPKGKGYGF